MLHCRFADIREVKMRAISDVRQKFSSRFLARASKNNASDLQLTLNLEFTPNLT